MLTKVIPTREVDEVAEFSRRDPPARVAAWFDWISCGRGSVAGWRDRPTQVQPGTEPCLHVPRETTGAGTLDIVLKERLPGWDTITAWKSIRTRCALVEDLISEVRSDVVDRFQTELQQLGRRPAVSRIDPAHGRTRRIAGIARDPGDWVGWRLRDNEPPADPQEWRCTLGYYSRGSEGSNYHAIKCTSAARVASEYFGALLHHGDTVLKSTPEHGLI